MGWQPIETAPRNGVWFFAANAWGECCVVRLDGPEARLPGMWVRPPTHWISLPPIPTNRSEGGGDD